jgi:hypothetical protein
MTAREKKNKGCTPSIEGGCFTALHCITVSAINLSENVGGRRSLIRELLSSPTPGDPT